MSVGLQRLRDEPDAIRRAAFDKGEDPAPVDAALALDAERRALAGETDTLRARRKDLSAQVAAAMRAGERDAADRLRAASIEIGNEIEGNELRLRQIEAELDELMLRIPNPADPDVPIGGEEENAIVRAWGEPVPHEADGWHRAPHWEIAEGLGIVDLAGGAKVAGSGFPVYRAAGSALQRALINLMIDIHTREHGMVEIWPPALVNEESARGTGQVPDKEDQMYVVTRDELYLVPTAEVPVTNLHRDEILDEARLPLRYVAYSPCFRREAGAAGARTRGLLRVHQFDKVEMVSFERPPESAAALEWLTERAEVVLRRLGLAYRVKLMATRDMGFTQAKKFDLEVWAPGVEDWLEVSSVSNFRDFQARRMAIRYRPIGGGRPELVHTLNGSGLALARTVAALLEVYQRQDGSIAVPEALRPTLGDELRA
jgi:seryl-tRNA synthetase